MYALYWATATVGTVGYGDVAAVSVAEKMVSILVIIMGERYECGRVWMRKGGRWQLNTIHTTYTTSIMHSR